ncbi:MAG: hypothetical protein JNL38_28840 [Myxococcales bacterium]|nr:hypothetical protein [Myxococcales bacterium]
MPRARSALAIGAACAALAAACAKPRQAKSPEEPVPEWLVSSVAGAGDACVARAREAHAIRARLACAPFARPVSAWGPPPRGRAPRPYCPVRVRVVGEQVVAESRSATGGFDDLPFEDCPPYQYYARHVIEVEDGWLVAYEGAFYSQIVWRSRDGADEQLVSAARITGFVRAPSGAVLGLAIARVRLGRGAVVRFERTPKGWALRLVSILPLEPSPAVFDDGGVLVGFAKGFVFRADEAGHVENVAYVARDVGHVGSIAKTGAGSYYLGLECGVLKIRADAHVEEWWSARGGATGRWRGCDEEEEEVEGGGAVSSVGR